MKTTVTLSLTIEARQRLEELARLSGKYMSTVVEDLLGSVPAVNGAVVGDGGKRMLAVQGLDGVLKVDGSIQLSDQPG